MMTVWVRFLRASGTVCATACARGGEATPVLDPANSTPVARTTVVGAAAMSRIPAVAIVPAATATTRPPRRGVRIVDPMTARQ